MTPTSGPPAPPQGSAGARLTVPAIRDRKLAQADGKGAGPSTAGAVPLVMVTAYDAPGAAIADRAGVDLILVGDSVAMAVLGYEDTLQMDVEGMAHHVGAVARARPRAVVVADLPWLSYHTGPADAVANAAVLIRAGAQAVKLEGGRRRLPVVEALLGAEIPVMGHLGLTPQSVHGMGGFRVQARETAAAAALVEDARALAQAGCFALVLEGVPDVVAQVVTGAVPVPTIGIGAGPGCDGQVLVFHDVLGLHVDGPGPAGARPRFVRRYADLGGNAVAALTAWAGDVRAGRFPSCEESYHAGEALTAWAVTVR